jgi:hypothetical protein
MALPFFSPLSWFCQVAGLEERDEPSGERVLRLIQIRLMCIVYTGTAGILSSPGAA